MIPGPLVGSHGCINVLPGGEGLGGEGERLQRRAPLISKSTETGTTKQKVGKKEKRRRGKKNNPRVVTEPGPAEGTRTNGGKGGGREVVE